MESREVLIGTDVHAAAEDGSTGMRRRRRHEVRVAVAAAAVVLLGFGCTESLEVLTGPERDGGPRDGGPGSATCAEPYRCPEGARFRREGPDGVCQWENLPLPGGQDLGAYCEFFEMRYMGFYWTPDGSDDAYRCPANSVESSNSEGQRFCLFQDYTLPAGAVSDCAELRDTRRLGFRWVCADE